MPGGALLYGGPRPQNCLQGDDSLPSVDRTLGLYRRKQRIESDYRKEVTGYGDTKRDCAAAQGGRSLPVPARRHGRRDREDGLELGAPGDSRREVRGGQAAREGAGRAHGGSGGRGMTGKSYELPDDITTLGGMVTWAGEDAEWHTEVFEFLVDARDAFREHVLAGDVAYMARLVELDRRQALDPVSYDVMEIDPAPGEWPFGRGRE
nr:MAG TPA: hypothetical protein [Caudoviricetes sp.]